ncbi:MAG: phosphate regulon sensor protein PhoR, partial [Burkholderiales bacterium]
MNPAWSSTLAVAVAAAAAGLPWGWRGAAAVLALALLFHTVQIAAFLRWLRRPARDALPPGRGLWEEAFATLH